MKKNKNDISAREDKAKKNTLFNLSDINKTNFDDRWVKFAFGSQGFINSADLNLGIVNFAKNRVSLNHSHNVDEALFVLSGRGKIRINDKTYPALKNDFVHIPAHHEHQIITGDSNIKILFVLGGKININY